MEIKNIKLNKMFCLVLFTLLVLFIMPTNSFAGTQRWNALDYDVTLNSDGSADVVETWDVYVSETNTLFKTFEMSPYERYEITNPKVTRVENGVEKELRQIYEEQYHVDSGCYYGLLKNSYEYEIAWNVGLDYSSDTRTYKMYYTIEDAITLYDDCAEFYWQFLSTNNGMPGNNITGTIRLPKAVSNLEHLRVWAHGDLTGEIQKASNSLVKFNLPSIYANDMLEVRIVVEETDMFFDSTNKKYGDQLESIISEETAWADEANREREEAQNVLNSFLTGFMIFAGINVLIIAFAIYKAGQYKKQRREILERYGDVDKRFEMVYFRDIPEEKKATPARAVYLRNFTNNSSYLTNKTSEVFAATILNLSLKGILRFESDPMNKVKIYLNDNIDSLESELPEDEAVILDLIKDALKDKRVREPYLTPDIFNYYARRNFDNFHMKMDSLTNKVERILENEYKIDKVKKDLAKKWSQKYGIYLIAAIFTFFMGYMLPGIFISMLILMFSARKVVKCFSFLTESGAEEAAMWKGLERYMDQYSMLDDKLAGDIVLWEKYLVYATAFGIADKVIKQIKIVHPEMFDASSSAYNSRMGYWHVVNSPYGYNNFTSFTRDLKGVSDAARSAYATAHSSSSSGSGGGGGFSGGGGGGGGGGSCGGR